MNQPVTLHHIHQRLQPLWELDCEITPALHWRGWLGIALAALLAALPLLAALFLPEPSPAKAIRVELHKSQAELAQTYLVLSAARAQREAADRKLSPLVTSEDAHGHALTH